MIRGRSVPTAASTITLLFPGGGLEKKARRFLISTRQRKLYSSGGSVWRGVHPGDGAVRCSIVFMRRVPLPPTIITLFLGEIGCENGSKVLSFDTTSSSAQTVGVALFSAPKETGTDAAPQPLHCNLNHFHYTVGSRIARFDTDISKHRIFDISKYRSFDTSNYRTCFCPPSPGIPVLFSQVLNESFDVYQLSKSYISTSFFFVCRYRIELHSDIDIQHYVFIVTKEVPIQYIFWSDGYCTAIIYTGTRYVQ